MIVIKPRPMKPEMNEISRFPGTKFAEFLHHAHIASTSCIVKTERKAKHYVTSNKI